MKFCLPGSLRLAAPVAAVLVLSACADDGRPAKLSGVTPIDIPAANTTTQTNFNINNPTLESPATFPVKDGDLLTLVWSDEFNGAQLDPDTWYFESGDGGQYGIPGWGNNELQYYLPESARVEDGKLKIAAKRERVGDFGFTSARIHTRDRVAFKYGRIEASIKLPSGQGIWPAFWMLPQDDEPGAAPGAGIYGDYAQSGEIDIAEAVNLDANPAPSGLGGGNEIFSTIHFGGPAASGQNLSSETRYTPSVDVTADFHTYAFEWDEFEMRWYFDGVLYKVENSWSSTGGAFPAPFDQPFYVLFNVAVGGNFPGSPDGTTPLPATMEVDWVRIYSGEDNYVPADRGTVPDDVIYATDPGETVDLVFGVDYTGFEPFGSGSTFNNNNTSDRDFSPAFGVTTGNGYTAQVGQLGIVGFAEGFATGYESLQFKAKNLNNNLIRVKFNPSGAYLDIDLASSSYSTALGNGWYEVIVPIADFSGVATATDLLFETDNTAPNPFTFLLTDLGFNAGGGGSADPGLVPDDVIYATDPGETVDLVATITAFGTSSMFDGMYALDADFNPAFLAQSGSGYGLDNILQLGFVDLGAGFATAYETFSFKIKSDDLPNNTIIVKLEQGGAYGDVVLSDTNVSTPLGNGWYQVVLPMSGFSNVDPAVGILFEAVGPQNGAGGVPFSMLVTDIGFSGTGGGGSGGGGGTAEGDISVNGGFETGNFDGWELFPNGGTQTITTSNPSSGTFAANLFVPVRSEGDAAVDNLIKNANLEAGNLTPGASVTVSFDMRGSLSGAGGVVFAEFFSELSGGGTSKAEIFTGGPLTLNENWTNYSFNTTLGPDVSGGVTLQLKTSCGPVVGCGVDAFFDNISIVLN